MTYIIFVDNNTYRTTDNYTGAWEMYRDAVEANPDALVELYDSKHFEFIKCSDED